MSHFYESLHPEDIPRSHRGEPVEDEEAADTAVTEWFGGRQPVLEPIEALLGGIDESE